MITNPIVYNENGRAGDIISLNLENRIVMLTGTITPELATMINSQLLYLDSLEHKTIALYINSPGGDVSAGLSIYDTMKSLQSEVVTICQGMAASMGAIIFSGGVKGKRLILSHSEVMIHQPMAGMEGKATDLHISLERLDRMHKILEKILSDNCDKPIEQVSTDMKSDYWMTAKEAIAYGIADKII